MDALIIFSIVLFFFALGRDAAPLAAAAAAAIPAMHMYLRTHNE